MANSAKHPVYIPVEGVDNEISARNLEEKLSQVKGISSSRVEVNNKRAVIEPANGLSMMPEAVKTIRELGYDIPSVKRTFTVLEMSCASCAISAESMVSSRKE
jgi:P-type Cu2+ transporter